MFIGHLPAGYLLTRSLYTETSGRRSAKIIWMLTGLLCSVLPDVDLIYFYLIDHRQHLHHGYWTHLPIFWLIIIFLMWTGIAISGKKALMPWLKLGGLNILIHLLLDTIVGKIRWLYPLSKQDYYLFEVPSLYNHFVLNFVLHWSFLLEIVLCIAAAYVFLKNRKPLG